MDPPGPGSARSLPEVCGEDPPWTLADPKTFLTEERRWFKEGSLAEVPDLDADPSAAEILSWPLEPGDALAFHMLTLHAASGSKALRRALSLRFIGTDVVYAPRSWRTSPAFPELKNALWPGAPMIHPLFPVVWPKADG